ncbi:MAG: ABC transporter permease [Anaerolineae bacterium]
MATQTQVAKLKVERGSKDVGQSLTRMAVRRLRRDHLTLLAIAIILIMAAMAAGAEVISNALNVDYRTTNADITFQPLLTQTAMPDGSIAYHVLGTDDLGRDHLSRLLYAGRISLTVGFLAAAISLTIGVSLGIVTGFYGGIQDDIVNWVIATLTSIPSLFLLLIVAAIMPFARPNDADPCARLPRLDRGTTRLVRGETLSLREREYVISARAIGASPIRIMFSHILPNLFSVIVVTLAIDIGSLILVEAALSYLGLGIKPPTPSWGNMLTGSQSFFNKGVHLVIFPGLMIFVTVLCLYVIGDGVRDAFDPTAKD